MLTLHRTVETSAAPDVAFAYLADFENAAQWDSGTVSCRRVSGEGGPGTVYRNVSRFAGREVELDYLVETRQAPTFVIVGQNSTTTSHDTIEVHPQGSGSVVVYTAVFTFRGVARFLGPVMVPLLNRLGDRTADQLRRCLDALPGADQR